MRTVSAPRFRVSLVLLTLLLLAAVPAYAAEPLTIAAGAGYKKLVSELAASFATQSGETPQQIFGNMGQVTAQAEQSGVVDVVIGDKTYLDGTTLPWAEEYPIGRGRLMLVVANGVDLDMELPDTLDANAATAVLTSEGVERIAMPDAKKAIYGRAGTQTLAKLGLAEQLAPKLIVVGTVPQVSAYLISGEVDLGFINLTDALAIQDRVQKIMEVDQALYAPIAIVGKRLDDCPHPEAAAAFGAFLKTDAARAIAAKHGL